MLKQRIITALIAAPLFLGGIFFLPPLFFSIFIALIIGLAGWEWANLSSLEQPGKRWAFALFILLLISLTSLMPGRYFLLLSVAWWVLALILVINYPDKTNHWAAPPIRLFMGVLVLLPAWHALVFLRNGALFLDAPVNNLLMILYVMFIVWGADVGAYFAGRAFGDRKLAPNVSPGKSWAGVYGGLAVVAMLSLGVSAWVGMSIGQSFSLLLVSLFTGMVSVLGDLLESMLKRFRGIKDSSQLLPGHGGVMDRIDSLTAALPIFAFSMLALGWMG